MFRVIKKRTRKTNVLTLPRIEIPDPQLGIYINRKSSCIREREREREKERERERERERLVWSERERERERERESERERKMTVET
jgi:hypothetical protein